MQYIKHNIGIKGISDAEVEGSYSMSQEDHTNLYHHSINEIENWYQCGCLQYDELKKYLRFWNAQYNIKHFHKAVWADGAIRLFDPERTSGNAYAHLKTEFGL